MGPKTGSRGTKIELDELYRMHYLLFLWCPPPKPKKNPKYYQKITKKRYTFSKYHHDSPIEGTKTRNTHRPIELDELYRIDSFLLNFHAFISPKTPKYLQNPGFSRKLHHDSPIEGTKTSNLYRSIELEELYRIIMTSFALNHWIPSERANPRRSAEFVFSSRRCFFLKNMKIAVTGPFSEEYYITKETGEKMCFAYTFRFMLLFFYLSENRERTPSINLLFYHFWRYFAVLEDMQA